MTILAIVALMGAVIAAVVMGAYWFVIALTEPWTSSEESEPSGDISGTRQAATSEFHD